MANTSRIFGLRPVGHIDGSPYNGQARLYFVPASDGTAMFVGDAVKFAGSADSATGVPTIAQAAATNALLGSIVGFRANPSDLTVMHRAASTARYVLVADDPSIVFEIQEDAVGGALAVADVGLNASLIVGSGSTTSGLSGMELDTSTKATTAALELKILGFVNREDNEIGNANAKVLVKINNHQLGSHTGTAGV